MKRFFTVLTLMASLMATPVVAAEFINVATGGMGGTYYPVGATIASIWSKEIPGLKATAQSTGGTINNIQLLESGDAEVCMSDGMYYSAYNGTETYAGKPKKFLRGIAVMYPDVVHMMVAKGSGIKSIKDLKGKRISVGPIGGSIPLVSEAILKAVGLDMHKDVTPEYLNHAETAAAMADGHIDASVSLSAIGVSSVTEMTTLGTAELIPLEPEVIKYMTDQFPYFAEYTIKEGQYKDQKAAVTISLPNILAVHEKVSPDMVYKMTETLFKNKPALLAVTATLEDMKPESASQIQIPLHPGAEKFYKEKGYIK